MGEVVCYSKGKGEYGATENIFPNILKKNLLQMTEDFPNPSASNSQVLGLQEYDITSGSKDLH